jgi:uncharacterized protein
VKIWIDLSNSPHALLFAPIARALRSSGHDVAVTARDNAQTVQLAAREWPALEVIGGASPAGLTGKAGVLVGRVSNLVAWARRAKPDVALSHNSYAQIVAARLLHIPSVTAMDFEHQPANHLAFRLATRVLLPEAMKSLDLRKQGITTRKTRYYAGLKEEIYLGDFEPDPDVLASAGVETGEGDVVIVARTPPSRAAYHRFGNPLFEETLRLAADQPRSRIVVLARHPEQRESLRELGLTHLSVPEAALDARSLMFRADLVIGAGGTMTREAALLGTPTFSLFAGAKPAVDRLLERQGLLRHLNEASEILPLQPRVSAPRSLDDVRRRGAELVDWFVANVGETARKAR